MRKAYIIWDPGSHEHLVRYNKKTPRRSRWAFLDTDVHDLRRVQTFGSIAEAKSAAKRIMRGNEDAFWGQLAIKEVAPAWMETDRYIPRVDADEQK